ncbi:HAMP domain-containing protein [Azospirillum lipoferum]|uniref:HAMP domain-containing protein n=2 Tax=Azospirillaceae TaxID=2829815 RepID=A0A5A9GKE9_AZOLI|nr:HAMP domain-containing protein [Azospirillum lipoferum]
MPKERIMGGGRRKSTKERRGFGIRRRLFLSFGAVALMTLISGLVAWMSFDSLSRSLAAITGRSIPVLSTANRLAVEGSRMVALAPLLANAAQSAERQRIMESIDDHGTRLSRLLAAVEKAGTAPKPLAALRSQVDRITANLDALHTSVMSRMDLLDDQVRAVSTVRTTQDALLKALTPLIDKTASSLETGTPDTSVGGFRKLLELETTGNLLVGLIVEAANAPDAQSLGKLAERSKPVATQFAGQLEALGDAAETKPAAELGRRLLGFAQGSSAMPVLRQRSLDALEQEHALLTANLDASALLSAAAADLVAASQDDVDHASEVAADTLLRGRLWIGGLATASVLASLLLVWLVVTRGITRRLVGLSGAMRAIAGGDLSPVVEASGRDEITEMARALLVFRDNIREIDAANARTEDERRRGAADRQRAIGALATSLEDGVNAVVVALSGRAGEMHALANVMTAAVERNEAEASGAAATAVETQANVRQVAVAAQQLSGAIDEIARQVDRSRRLSTQAVSEAKATDATMHEMEDAAMEIGKVVDLITEIAGQTNLLALNATIEAARAGEAGKGFAVVASEVKSLAVQTGRATEQITRRIAAMQAVSNTASEAIRHIGETIDAIYQIAAGVAAAVEEQTAATREIVRNVDHAANGTQSLSTSIAEVSAVAGQTGTAALRVRDVSGDVTDQARTLEILLKDAVDRFRAA